MSWLHEEKIGKKLTDLREGMQWRRYGWCLPGR